jgi:hypothetical protein
LFVCFLFFSFFWMIKIKFKDSQRKKRVTFAVCRVPNDSSPISSIDNLYCIWIYYQVFGYVLGSISPYFSFSVELSNPNFLFVQKERRHNVGFREPGSIVSWRWPLKTRPWTAHDFHVVIINKDHKIDSMGLWVFSEDVHESWTTALRSRKYSKCIHQDQIPLRFLPVSLLISVTTLFLIVYWLTS